MYDWLWEQKVGGGLKTLKRTLSEGWQSSEAKGKQFIYRRNFTEVVVCDDITNRNGAL